MPPQVLRTMSSRPEGFRRDEIKDLSLVVEYLDWVDLALENGEFPKWRTTIVVRLLHRPIMIGGADGSKRVFANLYECY